MGLEICQAMLGLRKLTNLVAHDPRQMFEKFLERSELLGADGDDDALVELVGVDEEANFLGALLGRDMNQ
jgi:hypothetical protein